MIYFPQLKNFHCIWRGRRKMKKLSAQISARLSSRQSIKTPVPLYYASLDIKFDHHSKDYFMPGDEVAGTVELHVERRLNKAKGLKLTIIGIARCGWKKGKGKSSIKFEGREKIFESHQYFFGKPNAEPVELPTGIHLYKFSCKMPMSVVSSHHGTHGAINYKVIATLDVSGMKDIVYEKPFTVLRIENLNDFPWMRCAVDNEIEFSDTFACCESQPLGMFLKVNKSGFGLGEKIQVEVQATNQGQTIFDTTSLSLDRVEICNSTKPVSNSTKSRKIITYVKMREIRAFEELAWEEELTIPKDMPVTSFKLCEVLQITYELNFMAKSTKTATANVYLPITIGHISLKSEEKKESLTSVDDQSAQIVETLVVPELTRLTKSASTASTKKSNQQPSKWTFVV